MIPMGPDMIHAATSILRAKARSQAAWLAQDEEWRSATRDPRSFLYYKGDPTMPPPALARHQSKCLYCRSRGSGTHCCGCGAPLP